MRERRRERERERDRERQRETERQRQRQRESSEQPPPCDRAPCWVWRPSCRVPRTNGPDLPLSPGKTLWAQTLLRAVPRFIYSAIQTPFRAVSTFVPPLRPARLPTLPASIHQALPPHNPAIPLATRPATPSGPSLKQARHTIPSSRPATPNSHPDQTPPSHPASHPTRPPCQRPKRRPLAAFHPRSPRVERLQDNMMLSALQLAHVCVCAKYLQTPTSFLHTVHTHTSFSNPPPPSFLQPPPLFSPTPQPPPVLQPLRTSTPTSFLQTPNGVGAAWRWSGNSVGAA